MTGSQTTGVMLISDERCFAEIAGLPLWQRLLLSGQKAGLDTWLILAWHGAQRLRSSLAADARFQGLSCQVYDVKALTPTALSALLPPDELLLLSGTALADDALLNAFLATSGPTLGVTTRAVPAAACVTRQGDAVVPCPPGASARFYSAGLLCGPGTLLRPIVARAWISPPCPSAPLDAILPPLLASTTVRALDVDPYLWEPLGEPLQARRAAAETRLFRHLGRRGDSLIVRRLNRHLSRTLTRRLVRTPITPNQITLFSAFLGLCGAALLAQPTELAQVLGSLLFLGSTIIDGCDGEVARLKFQESDFGGKLDIIMDNVVHLFLFPGIALGLYRETHQPLALWLGALTLGGVLLSWAVYVPSLWRPSRPEGGPSRLHESLASRDFAYLLVVLAVLDRLDWFLWATTLGTYAFALAWWVLSRRSPQAERRVSRGRKRASVPAQQPEQG